MRRTVLTALALCTVLSPPAGAWVAVRLPRPRAGRIRSVHLEMRQAEVSGDLTSVCVR